MFKVLPYLLILVKIPCQDSQSLRLTSPLHNPTLCTMQENAQVLTHAQPSPLCGPAAALILLPQMAPTHLPGQFHSVQPKMSIGISSLGVNLESPFLDCMKSIG